MSAGTVGRAWRPTARERGGAPSGEGPDVRAGEQPGGAPALAFAPPRASLAPAARRASAGTALGLAGARAAAVLALATALAACAAIPSPSLPRPREDLLREFREGRARLECRRCRYDFRGAEWLLRDGYHESLVLGILRSGDGSGRSWYWLGRAAEAGGHAEAAMRYYRESLATPRSPIVAMLPLWEDVNFRIRRLVTPLPATQTAAQPEPAGSAGEVEYVTVASLGVDTRPGHAGAFLKKLGRGDRVEVLDRSGDWEQVRLADGRVGWVWGRHTSASAAAAEPSPAAQPAETAAAAKPAEIAVASAEKAAQPEETVAKAAAVEEPLARPAEAPQTGATPTPALAPKPPAVEEPAAVETLARAAKPPAPARPRAAPKPAPRAKLVAAAKPAAAARPLAPAGTAGILGCPLPEGASLSARSQGADGAGDRPTETYAIEAPARAIVGFYERELERAGWRKTFLSSEFLLYFEKEHRTLGVLVDRAGGLFTLMGS
jgi:SH3-like domain-containing protein